MPSTKNPWVSYTGQGPIEFEHDKKNGPEISYKEQTMARLAKLITRGYSIVNEFTRNCYGYAVMTLFC